MADLLEDDDPSELAEHRFGYQEWDKLEENFVNAGYREGITAGKEDALQEGFDAGFAEHGVPLGREIGTLRGTAAALLFFIYKDGQALGEVEVQGNAGVTMQRHGRAVQEIATELGGINLTDLLPPDVEAIEHALEHARADNREAMVADADAELEARGRTWDNAKAKVEELRRRLNVILEDFGLPFDVI